MNVAVMNEDFLCHLINYRVSIRYNFVSYYIIDVSYVYISYYFYFYVNFNYVDFEIYFFGEYLYTHFTLVRRTNTLVMNELIPYDNNETVLLHANLVQDSSSCNFLNFEIHVCK